MVIPITGWNGDGPGVPPVPAHGSDCGYPDHRKESRRAGRRCAGVAVVGPPTGPSSRDPAFLVDVHVVDNGGQFFRTGDGILLDDANCNLYSIPDLLISKRLFWYSKHI